MNQSRSESARCDFKGANSYVVTEVIVKDEEMLQ
jgi:hypothetical protein